MNNNTLPTSFTIAWSAYLIWAGTASGSSSNGAGATRSRETVGTQGKRGKAI